MSGGRMWFRLKIKHTYNTTRGLLALSTTDGNSRRGPRRGAYSRERNTRLGTRTDSPSVEAEAQVAGRNEVGWVRSTHANNNKETRYSGPRVAPRASRPPRTALYCRELTMSDFALSNRRMIKRCDSACTDTQARAPHPARSCP
ncbi:unnamed protein product [Danaus chrysippus]|uniref:(African queen) hypothetical protein n=1 Tax=Danaus chrysippus TaxID=151541 RepID=A0A8J2QY62_9NEOP|nr:unnamed protein product [Danaus chrysippus]